MNIKQTDGDFGLTTMVGRMRWRKMDGLEWERGRSGREFTKATVGIDEAKLQIK